ncbi:MAG TPA: hypothetical protein VKH42_14780, partial [Vicinamibacterales bacterium]|nr:hypothetical protein [Vicinamibacterales bacterium]
WSADRFAVVITGASGGDAYAKKYDAWRATFVDTLRTKFGYQTDHLFVLAEHESEGVRTSTRENVRQVLADLRKRVTKDDQLLILLIGHGTPPDTEGAEGDTAKFNLVGPDLTAAEWLQLVAAIPGRLVFVDTSSASVPFLHRLAGRGRVVLTATDSAAQQYETVFADFFVKAFDDAAADGDKNGRVSIWEAFTYASAGVQAWFEQKGQLPTERPLLDDTGAGIGREAQNPGLDGAIARVTYIQPDAPIALPSDTALATLVRRQAELQSQIEELKARKDTTAAEQYETELERLLVELARVAVQIRSKS